MKLKNILTPTLVYRTALGVSFILVVSVAIVFHIQMNSLNTSVSSISESNKKQFELEKLISSITLKENSLRNYIITKDSTYFEQDSLVEKSIHNSLAVIKGSVPNQSDPKCIKSLDSLVAKRFQLFEETYEISELTPLNPEILKQKLSDGSEITKKITEKVYMLREKEIANLKIHNINHRYDIETSTITAFSLTIITLVVLLFSLSKVNYDYRKLQDLNRDLRFANQISDNAEKVAGISHWKINMVTGKYFYSDNFYRILGLKPNAFEQNLDNFIRYIHPEDVEECLKEHEHSLENHTATSLTYRIIRPDGEIRYINSVGDFTQNTKGELVKIGVSYDITEQQNSKLILEEKNKNLVAINAELESFNQIVSHDLQEPLRKIQMFISRLEGGEIDNITQVGKDYFSKIKISANRMQNLMMDLVAYSRTIKENKVFIQVELSEMLEDVIQELALNIEERKAEIIIKKLPQISAIPFQIHQLFVNLITNSLKYSNDNVTPIIKIYTAKIKSGETFNGIEITDKKYHKIIVSDNGIGFKQEFSEKIFALFKRLETQASYTGTGLGLAICKKVVENHNGFIKAKGIPNKGATFTIYLPK
ncbi:PAS domain-containing sensor histidine kinase [uncultured Flavobacterium sp.]|uniref:PAS domain-containing sensor histidine kinase n=1 Tax=uncultured Flavobacterium sp. TaxID=165435 RepID=UPI0025E6573B|nr:PAS domain-containing sensor histidine kinase [uncultured Flavobacterium sp.]